jgi:hypothetical protein
MVLEGRVSTAGPTGWGGTVGGGGLGSRYARRFGRTKTYTGAEGLEVGKESGYLHFVMWRKR